MEALSGLLGVFIGGVITAGVEAWKQRREADAEALAAARVLQAELRWAVLALTEFRDKGQTEGTFVSLARSSRWHEQQAAIARRASHDVWGCIEGAMEAPLHALRVPGRCTGRSSDWGAT